jgi:DNA-binding transcriptional ArsR family regulator/uncharacterized protein YndB with AHSA1/START domain
MDVTYSPAVWRAVAHPLRRRLIELLGGGPRTTGDLARAFPVSRFAVMKHLRLLERSGVISVDRRGRERWNILTIAPGLELRAAAGTAGEARRDRGADAVITPFRIEQQVLLDAPPGRVFDALTFNVSAWWGAPYLRSSSATNVVLEPQLGGRLFEEWGHRQGFIRGVVIGIRQDERLELAGRIAGVGSLAAALEFRLAHADRGTRLALVHRGVMEPEPGAAPGLPALCETAWADLVGVRLKAFVERGVRSGLAERPAAADAHFGWF